MSMLCCISCASNPALSIAVSRNVTDDLQVRFRLAVS